MTGDNPMTDDRGRVICGAKTRAGSPCRLPPMKGRTRCFRHGGATPVGVESPHYKHGRYSKYFPAAQRDMYLAALSDPDLMSVRSDVAATEVMIAELAAQLTDGASAAAWRALRAEVTRYRAAAAEGNVQRMRTSLDRVWEIADAGAVEVDRRDELARRIEDRRRLIETDSRMAAALRTSIPADQVFALFGGLLAILLRNVTDPDARTVIRSEARQLIGSDMALTSQ